MQGSKLYVGNLKYSVTQEEVQELFSQVGEVVEVRLIGDKGFGFVEMSSQEEAEKAKETFNNFEFQGRNLRVDEARPQKSRQRRDYRRY
jgi:RNA recognition motif-containing protein